MAVIRIGSIAPDFELQDQRGKMVKPSQFSSKKSILLAFFPFAFSPVCTNELGELKEKQGAIRKADAQILAVSVDSIWTQKAFAQQLGLSFPVLSDFGRRVSSAYGVLNEDGGFANRSVFIIDRQGRVAYVRLYEPEEEPDIGDAIKELERLK